jgi:hypothetical protein
VDTSDQRLIHLPDYCCTELPNTCNYERGMWIITNTWSSSPAPLGVTCYNQHLFFVETTTYRDTGQGGPSLMSSSTSVVAAAGLRPAPPGGPAIDVFSTSMVAAAGLRLALPRGPSSTSSSTLVVAAIGLRRAPPRGPAIYVFFSFGGGYCRTSASTP